MVQTRWAVSIIILVIKAYVEEPGLFIVLSVLFDTQIILYKCVFFISLT